MYCATAGTFPSTDFALVSNRRDALSKMSQLGLILGTGTPNSSKVESLEKVNHLIPNIGD